MARGRPRLAPGASPKGGAPGTRYERLTILGHDPVKAGSTWRVFCRCDCGKEHTALLSNIRQGLTRSCGCLAVEMARDMATTHGLTGAPIYTTWTGMIARCEQASGASFDRYGGRGIALCLRWRESVEAFASDMGAKPSEKHSVDRINNDGGYWCGKPECAECGPLGRAPNCRWATPREQRRNNSHVALVRVDGKDVPAVDLYERLGITRQAFEQRVRSGWDALRAATTPPNPRLVAAGRRNRIATLAARNPSPSVGSAA